MMKRYFIPLLLFSATVFSCKPLLYVPSSNNPEEQDELLLGRKLYVNYCSSCHNLHLPKEYNADQWKRNVDEMQEKAKITDDEKQLILQFLTYHNDH
ncbi:MAG: hypothetical protein C5B54_01245 [Acidobacteria bacterium]|nr:MAG: hypothetical protein C5B54_01245 [Acidobacteriota bacterium]